VTPLGRRLQQRIASSGPMSLADWMAACIGDPDHGYYATRDPFGAAGDFTTAPEMTQAFGEVLGAWVVGAWEALGRPARATLAEAGPGRGTLMADAMRLIRRVAPACAEALAVALVETSAVLRAAQARRLGDLAPTWVETVDALPDGPLLLLANEFLDALPLRQWRRSAVGWHERLVDWDGTAFRWIEAIGTGVPGDAPRDAPVGAVHEERPAAHDLAQHIAARFVVTPGYALFIDYAGDGAGSSLQAVASHRAADPLAAPGEADLTALVDFRAFARAAEGARVHGPVPQGALLTSLGLVERTRRLVAGADPVTARSLDLACRRLIAPAAMGSLFQALVVASPSLPPPPGFASEDQPTP
jgi:NADH dehydrogenase [ubiquinone] 1 alpha subcomplex assembly factor 7